MKKIISTIFLCLAVLSLSAQEDIGNSIVIDKKTHDFGDVLLENGPLTCTFTIQNNGDKPAVIYNVVTSCGCTDVKWTREPIRPGGKGTISVTYSNDEGAHPFDKNLTVYISGIKKPIILKIRGVAHEKKKSLNELYPTRFGPLGMKETYIKCGNIEQDGMRSDIAKVANLSGQPIKVEFIDVTPNLSITISPNPIPAHSIAEMEFTVYASRDRWGKNDYFATPLINGQRHTSTDSRKSIGIWAFTKENFNGLTQEQKENGPVPACDESTFSFGRIKQGTVVHAKFIIRNEGKEPLQVYKADINACKWSHSTFPVLAPGKEAEFRVHLDTATMPAGEALAIVTLVTNSPLRPIMNLFIAGWLD